mgnify:CR=1 FL=1|tara:strand:+ start:1469 stop:1801 length:333 start_codon:yes stop_codon:yes gene_type:complete
MPDTKTESFKVPYTLTYTAKSGDRSLKSTTVRTYEIVTILVTAGKGKAATASRVANARLQAQAQTAVSTFMGTAASVKWGMPIPLLTKVERVAAVMELATSDIQEILNEK